MEHLPTLIFEINEMERQGIYLKLPYRSLPGGQVFFHAILMLVSLGSWELSDLMELL